MICETHDYDDPTDTRDYCPDCEGAPQGDPHVTTAVAYLAALREDSPELSLLADMRHHYEQEDTNWLRLVCALITVQGGSVTLPRNLLEDLPGDMILVAESPTPDFITYRAHPKGAR